MKINRQINDCYCYNCRKYEQCRDGGAFAEGRDLIDFCVDYEDESYPDDDNDDNDEND